MDDAARHQRRFGERFARAYGDGGLSRCCGTMCTVVIGLVQYTCRGSLCCLLGIQNSPMPWEEAALVHGASDWARREARAASARMPVLLTAALDLPSTEQCCIHVRRTARGGNG